MKVLIVDDEILVRKGLSMSIPWSSLGFSCIFEASNGLEALELAIQETPNLILTDIKMPKMDGLQLIEELRYRHITSTIICLSCLTDLEYIRKAMRFDGALDYIPKLSMTDDELIEIIKKAIGFIKNEQLQTTVPSANSGFFLLFEQRLLLNHYLQQDALVLFKNEIELLFKKHDIFLMRDCIIPEILDVLAQPFYKLQYNLYEININQLGLLAYLKSTTNSSLKDAFFVVVSTIFNEYDRILTARYGREITTCIHYIYLNYKKSIGLIDLANLISMNMSYFSKYFKKKTGVTYIAYLNGIRIDIAKEYLQYTNNSIAQISYDIGYTNETYFSRLFKNIEGNSPALYRTQHAPNNLL